ncbi:hypothetical protein QH494_14595 [Sphingomonas sp. AR_OL41]|jgi:hypothetical protein|uniref:hypothetical protein n=1 Tax=Sphingomonas sp. AR_OL41 TaxID=3042729 RepID=UPI0024805FDF|nr:hypothetical protein [Sphingomonas sp. AR_OL41]MDH7973416.1 hypothetical protein [Sphingomonas sp. AR_OL41]
MRRVEGQVLTIRCTSCSSIFPTFVFSGDTDMATAGLETATSLEPTSVALGELTADEFRAGYESGRTLFAERISRQYGADFVALSVPRWVQGPSGEGLSLEEFRKIFKPASPVYDCPRCGGEAPVISQQSPAEFLETGGQLLVASSIALD